MRFDQSDLAACTPTWARPLATSTDIVSRHAEQNLCPMHQPDACTALPAQRDDGAPGPGKNAEAYRFPLGAFQATEL